MNKDAIIYKEIVQCSIELGHLEEDNFNLMLKLKKLKSDILTMF